MGLLGGGGYAPQTGNPTPAERYDPITYGGRYQYDKESGKIVFVPKAA